MTASDSPISRFISELHRRRVFATAGIYIVGAWLVMQGGDVFFSGWGIPDRGINVLLIAAVSGFPLALFFGWFFNITRHGIRRTLRVGLDEDPYSRPLKGGDYIVLAALLLASGAIVTRATQDILAMRSASPVAEAAAVEKLPNSIAVLPFANMSNNPENESFSDGVSEEIRNRLGLHAELQVIARTSSFQFKHGDYSIPRISELLGVRYLLQGSVRREGDRIRVTAQLVADRGTQIWSRNYDRVLEDVFGVQDEIADLVATEVAPQISASVDRGYTPNLEAYEYFLTGRDLLNQRDQWAAQRELAKAIELDPGYALAQAEYAISLLLGYPDQAQFRKADAAIGSALDTVPNLPRALAARGLYLSQQTPPDLAAAEAALRAALKGDPNMVDAMNWLGGALARQGKHQEADRWQERAYALDPFNSAISANMARRYWEEGNPERAESLLLPLLELPDPPMHAPMTLWYLYSDTGRLVEANGMAKRILGAAIWPVWFLARSYAVLGDFETAADLVEKSARRNTDIMWIRTGWLQAQIPYWKGDYKAAADEIHETLAANGVALEQLSPELRQFYGINLALSSDYAKAIETLVAALPGKVDEQPEGFDPFTVDAYQALAWSYAHSDMQEESRQLLEAVETSFEQYSGSVAMLKSADRFAAARNAVMMGNTELALERLQQAVTAGWREYNIQHHDPRWSSLVNDDRYLEIMKKVETDVIRQRVEVDQMATGEDFSPLHDDRENR